MQNTLNFQIREHLANYLAGQISRHDFEDWLIPATWDKVNDSDHQTADLIGEIELLLAEFSNGDLTEEELRDLLRPLVETMIVPFEVDGLVQRQDFLTSSESRVAMSPLLISEYQQKVLEFFPYSLVDDRSLMDNTQRNTREKLVIQ